MPIQIVPHAEHLETQVDAFNRRMHAGGSPWGFYVDHVPDWIPKENGSRVWREYHLAVEDEATVRGGYALKPQPWLIRGDIDCVTDWQGPFTEGAVNRRYSTLGLRMLRDMLSRYPLLYSLGHGANDQPMLQLLRSLGWTMHGTPFCLWVAKPSRFLRYNRFLRSSRAKSIALDGLAFSGLGYVGIRTLQAAQRISQGVWVRSHTDAEPVEWFGDWAQSLWERCKKHYECIAVRDQEIMNTLLPRSGWPGGTRLRIVRAGSVIGWAVVFRKEMNADPRFGELVVGLIGDCFGDPRDSQDIMAATHKYLQAQGVDIICSNQAHPAWIAGLRRIGYIVLPEKRLFAMSPQLRARLEPFHVTAAGLHLTNLDGHGPHGFTA